MVWLIQRSGPESFRVQHSDKGYTTQRKESGLGNRTPINTLGARTDALGKMWSLASSDVGIARAR